MLRALLFGPTAFAVLALTSGATPASAQDMATMCNPVVDSEGDAVVESEGGVVSHEGTYACPPEPEPVAQIAPAAPPPEPEPLPESGIVYFDFDEAALRADGQQLINQVVQDIRDRELTGITVAGHADTAGPPDYNMELSERRANTVAAELIQEGIPARVVQTQAYGETELAVPTPDGEPEQANRRVVIDFEG